MTIRHVCRRALANCAIAVLLSGCGVSQSPIGAPSAGAQLPTAPRGTPQGMYVSEFYGSAILGYPPNNRHDKPPSCTVPGVSYVNDVAVDGKGNLIDPDGGSQTVKVFEGPGMCGNQLGSISDPYGQPSDATSADAATGTIVVANAYDGPPSKDEPGSISLCTLAAGCTTNLTNSHIKVVAGVAQARNGDCWASVSTPSGGAALIYFKGCSGAGEPASHFKNKSYGGLDIDSDGDIVAISYASSELYVYAGCNPDCRLVGGPFPMRGGPFFGHLNEQSTRLAAVNAEAVTVDVYAYSPTHLRYLYSFSGVSGSNDLGGVAYNPRSKE